MIGLIRKALVAGAAAGATWLAAQGMIAGADVEVIGGGVAALIAGLITYFVPNATN